MFGLLRERLGARDGVVLLANTGVLVDLLGFRWAGLWRGIFAGGASSRSSDESVWFTASRWALSRRRASLVRLALWALRNLVCVGTHHDSVFSVNIWRVSHLMWLVYDSDVLCIVSDSICLVCVLWVYNTWSGPDECLSKNSYENPWYGLVLFFDSCCVHKCGSHLMWSSLNTCVFVS